METLSTTTRMVAGTSDSGKSTISTGKIVLEEKLLATFKPTWNVPSWSGVGEETPLNSGPLAVIVVPAENQASTPLPRPLLERTSSIF